MVRDSKENLVNYIKKNLKKGYTLEALRWALINQGYPKFAVEEAIKQANKELSLEAPILKEKPVIKYEILNEYGKPIAIKKPWWKKIFGL